jgi:TonB family protein
VSVNYPKEARKNKIEGSVNICALVDDKGRVRIWDILTKLGYGTEEEAVNGLKEIQFIPAIKDGRPIPYWTTVEFIFRLP